MKTKPTLAEIPLLPRRHFLWRSGGGLGALALACLLHDEGLGVGEGSDFGPRRSHFPGPAKRVLHIYAAGGVSHLDTFDYKPDLVKHDGKALTSKGEIDTFFGKPGNLMKSPWQFRKRGESGLWVSESGLWVSDLRSSA